jgi:hypothetical protein
MDLKNHRVMALFAFAIVITLLSSCQGKEESKAAFRRGKVFSNPIGV